MYKKIFFPCFDFLNYRNLTSKGSIGSSLDYKPKASPKVGIGTEYQYE